MYATPAEDQPTHIDSAAVDHEQLDPTEAIGAAAVDAALTAPQEPLNQ